MVYKKWFHKSVKRLLAETNAEDPIVVIKDRARSLVLDALEKGWTGPPFDALELSRLLGIETIPNDSIFDARILPIKKESFIIEYNPFQRATRLNFSLAHEIAHTLFSDCANEIRNRELEPNENRELEQLCNIAASEIQLPYAFFSNDANSINEINIENLVSLATKYRASFESLLLRFIDVVDKPCAIMICQFNDKTELEIEYSKQSFTFPKKIPSDFKIPKHSKAYDCISPGWSSRESTSWGFLDGVWNIHFIGLTPLRKDKRARVGVIISPSKENVHLQANKIQIEFGDATKPRGVGAKIIVQVVNTSAALGMGFGKSLSKNYPIVKESLVSWKKRKADFVLGKTQSIEVGKGIYVFQMLAQNGIFSTNGEIPLKYTSLRNCLRELAVFAIQKKATIHMPMIGAGQGKGNWEIIFGMIHDELVSKNLLVNIYMLPGKSYSFKSKSTLINFKEESTWQIAKSY